LKRWFKDGVTWGNKNILFIVLASSIEENAAFGSEIDPKDLKKISQKQKIKSSKSEAVQSEK
jgi:hypothetical protein